MNYDYDYYHYHEMRNDERGTRLHVGGSFGCPCPWYPLSSWRSYKCLLSVGVHTDEMGVEESAENVE